MENFGAKLRSRIPVIELFKRDEGGGGGGKNEETYLLDSTSSPNTTNPNYSELFSVENTTTTFQPDNNNNNNSSNSFDIIENDLIEYSGEGASQNRIDEWQAAWNVTNAIQVG